MLVYFYYKGIKGHELIKSLKEVWNKQLNEQPKLYMYTVLRKSNELSKEEQDNFLVESLKPENDAILSRQLISFFIAKQNPGLYADKLPIFE